MTDTLWPSSPDDGQLGIRGGVGGIRFQWEELEEAAGVLALLATDTGDIAGVLGGLDRDLDELPWRVLPLQPVGGVAGPRYQSAQALLGMARGSALESSRGLAITGSRLRSALLAYRFADQAALAVTEAARGGTGAAARAVARRALEEGVLRVGPIGVEAESAGVRVPFDGTVGGVLDRLAAVEAEAPGTFEVLRAGSASDPVYVVVLPGTQGGTTDGNAGSNPFDAGGVAEALAEDSRFTEAAVLEALEQAGARQGNAVMVAGYSQGGLHAVNLAGSDSVGERYDVQLVMTVGSPTGWHATGSSEYLHIEHASDLVPGLDSSPNGDERNRTTVTLGTPVPPLGRRPDGSAEPWGLGPAHKLETYAEGARVVDASHAPSLAPATALLAVAGVSGAARRYSFTAVRREPPAVRPVPGMSRPAHPERPIRPAG